MVTTPDFFKITSETLTKIKVRPFDRFIIGPFMIWYGLRSKKMSHWPRRVLIAGGIYQVIYGINDYRKLLDAAKSGPTDIITVIQNEPARELDI